MIDNKSGIYPVEYKVLVKVDKIEEKTQGGIILPDTVKDQESMAHTRGVLIAIGGNAFCHLEEPIPRPGMRVIIAKYSGLFTVGEDGEEYRLMNDKDIAALLEDPT